jgi:hypothetical protein
MRGSKRGCLFTAAHLFAAAAILPHDFSGSKFPGSVPQIRILFVSEPLMRMHLIKIQLSEFNRPNINRKAENLTLLKFCKGLLSLTFFEFLTD